MSVPLFAGREGHNLPECMQDECTIEVSLIDGRIEKTYPLYFWPLHIAISSELLDDIHKGISPQGCASAGDGFVRFTMSNGDTALYGQAACESHDDHGLACTHFDRLQPVAAYGDGS